MANPATTETSKKKSKRTRTHREFWSRNLQASKVKATLEGMNVSLEAFQTGYKATRKEREGKEISDAEVLAFRSFQEHKSMDRLAKELDVSPLTASVRFTRAMMEGKL